MKRVHVTSCIRSGTTLLVEMMRFGFESDGPWEHETSLLGSLPNDLDVCITKHPGELDLLARLLPHDPSLHGLYVMRDPRAVITSIHRKARDCYATNLAHWKRCDQQASQLRLGERFVRVRYEMLVSEPDMVQEQLARAFPFLIAKAPFSSFQQTASLSDDANDALNGIRPVTTERIESWRNHLSRVKEQFAQHPDLPDLLISNGYERDAQWLSMLDGVESRHHKTWQDSGVHFLKRIDRWQRRERRVRHYLSDVRRRKTNANPVTTRMHNGEFPASVQAALEPKRVNGLSKGKNRSPHFQAR